MIDGFEAFNIFQAVRLHFQQESFDYFKYNGKSKTSLESFNARKDKYAFVKLGRMFPTDTELAYFLAINFYAAEGKSLWVRDLFDPECSKRYAQWILDQKNQVELFTVDLKKLPLLSSLVSCEDGQNPKLLVKVYQKDIRQDTLVILDYFMKLTNGWNNHLKEDFIWKSFYKNFKKYQSFFFNHTLFNITQYKSIILQHIGSNNG